MSFAISTQAELLKTKRSASFWISIIGAPFLPVIFLLVLPSNHNKLLEDLQPIPGKKFFWRDGKFSRFSVSHVCYSRFYFDSANGI